MKIRLTLLSAILLVFSYLTPVGFAQAQTQDPGTAAPADSTAKKDSSATKDDQAKPAETPVPAADPDKVKHDGGKNDVDAIGNRKMGGRGLGNWYSVEGEIRMGKQYAQQVEASSKMIADPVIAEYVNRVGQNLVRNSDSQVPFTIKVIDSDEINAFALPGGFFYVNSGLILAADDEAELAGVMAHEIAHVAAAVGQHRYYSADLHGGRFGIRNSRRRWDRPPDDLPDLPARFRGGGGLSRSAVHV
jgi:predicted Zn-dependent protease